MPHITPCLWFDGNAEEAVNFYLSIFKDGKITSKVPYGSTNPDKADAILTLTFTMMGNEYMALNGGPEFKFNEAISLMVPCKTQEEIDYYWEKLTADGGKPVECGWVKDKFGLSWQIVPELIGEMMKNGDEAARARVFQAVWQMKKLDLATLEKAYKGA